MQNNNILIDILLIFCYSCLIVIMPFHRGNKVADTGSKPAVAAIPRGPATQRITSLYDLFPRDRMPP